MNTQESLKDHHFNPKFEGYRFHARKILEGEHLTNTGGKDLLRAALDSGTPPVITPAQETMLLTMFEYACRPLGNAHHLLAHLAPDHPYTAAVRDASLIISAVCQDLKGKVWDEAIAQKIADDYKGDKDAKWLPGEAKASNEPDAEPPSAA
jgi:hypothetical protein